jgi:hypothetical protein
VTHFLLDAKPQFYDALGGDLHRIVVSEVPPR